MKTSKEVGVNMASLGSQIFQFDCSRAAFKGEAGRESEVFPKFSMFCCH